MKHLSKLLAVLLTSALMGAIFVGCDVGGESGDEPLDESSITEESLPEEENEENEPVEDTSQTEVPTPEEPAKTNLSKEDAEAIFKEHYPNATIEVSKLEGEVYFIKGFEGNMIHEMKIRVSNGEIVYNNTITKGDVQGNPPAEKPATETPEEKAVKSDLSKSDAEAIFQDYHPNATIQISKLEGDVYYIEGTEGNTIYKMKIRVSNGEILLDKTITRGRR